MYTDKYLRFESQAQAESVLFTAKQIPVFTLVSVADETVNIWVYTDSDSNEYTFSAEPSSAKIAEDGLTFVRIDTEPKMESQQTGVTVELTPKYRNIDVLGVIYEKAPEPVPEGYEPVAVSGYHCNVRLVDGEDGSVLEPYSVVPSAPRRIWWN